MCKFFWFPQTETSHRKNVIVHLWLKRIMISAEIIWCIWYTTILHPYKCDNTVTDWHDEMIFNGKGKGETRIKLTPRQVRDHEDFWIQDKPVVKMSRGVRLIDPVCVWVQYFIVSFSRFDLLEQIYAFFLLCLQNTTIFFRSYDTHFPDQWQDCNKKTAHLLQKWHFCYEKLQIYSNSEITTTLKDNHNWRHTLKKTFSLFGYL